MPKTNNFTHLAVKSKNTFNPSHIFPKIQTFIVSSRKSFSNIPNQNNYQNTQIKPQARQPLASLQSSQNSILSLIPFVSHYQLLMSGLIAQSQKPKHQQVSKQKPSNPKRKRFAAQHSQSESYEPDLYEIKKHGFSARANRLSFGTWTLQENRLYLAFMQQHRSELQTQRNRRRTKVFHRLSKILKRTPRQCRSHHQKLQIKYKDDLTLIMQSVRQMIMQLSANFQIQHLNAKTYPFFQKPTSAMNDTKDDDAAPTVFRCVDFAQLALW